MLLTCSHCQAPVNCAAGTGESYWCPFCRKGFAPVSEKPLPVAIPFLAAVALRTETAVRAVAPPPLPAPMPAVAPRPRVPLPAGMPAEVTALGDPEAVYPPDPIQVAFNRNLVHVLAGTIAVMMLGVAALMFYAYFQPSFGTNRPPDAVFLGVGLGLFVLGLLIVAAGIWTTNSRFGLNRWGPRTYLVYRDGLVEVFPDHHRLIPFVQIRAPQTTTVVVSMYRFPVDGEKPLVFDNMTSDHAGFCELIRTKAAERRFVESSGDESVLTELRRVPVGPSVLTVNCQFVGEVYRVTVLGDRLLFYKVAAGLGVLPTPPPNPMGGLVGAMAVWGHAQVRRKFLAEMRVVEAADAATLLDLAARNEGSFVACAADVRGAQLDPPSPVRQFLFGPRGTEQRGLLKLVHARKGTLTLALLSHEDVRTVREWWPGILGRTLTGNGG